MYTFAGKHKFTSCSCIVTWLNRGTLRSDHGGTWMLRAYSEQSGLSPGYRVQAEDIRQGRTVLPVHHNHYELLGWTQLVCACVCGRIRTRVGVVVCVRRTVYVVDTKQVWLGNLLWKLLPLFLYELDNIINLIKKKN